jgi:uncharacterized protein (DUF2141 family)
MQEEKRLARWHAALAVALLLLRAGSAAAQGGAPPGSAPAARQAEPVPEVRPPEPAPAAPAGATLTVVVTGVAEAKGQLIVRVFTSADGWPKPKHAAASAIVPARAPETEVRFPGLPPGPCAVSVVHDLDGDGKLTMRWFPYPHPGEPTGASNGATGHLGPPSFEAARIELSPGGTTAKVALRP